MDKQHTPLPSFVPDMSLDSITPTIDADTILRLLASLSASNQGSPDEMVLIKLQIIERLLGADHVYVGQITSNDLFITHSCGRWPHYLGVGQVVPIEETICQYVKSTGSMIVINNATQDVRVTHVDHSMYFPIGSYIGAPLYNSEGSLYGTLSVINSKPYSFSSAQLALVQLLAGEVAYIIERETLLQRMLRAVDDAGHDLGATLTVLDKQQMVLRIVAHDLRTPLSAIFTGSEAMLQEMFGPIDPPKRRVLDLIDTASRYMNRLVNDLLDASAAEDPMLALVIERFDVVDAGRELVAVCEQRAHEEGLELELETDIADPIVDGDRARLIQALMNLISNAIVYTPSGTVTLRITGNESHVLFEVVDTGPGIAPEDLDRIWSQNVRATRKGRGLGLGLYVVALLAAKMGGDAGVRSTLGVGSTFWFRLPRTGPAPQLTRWSGE